MLRHVRMTASEELQRSIMILGQGQLWAGSGT